MNSTVATLAAVGGGRGQFQPGQMPPGGGAFGGPGGVGGFPGGRGFMMFGGPFGSIIMTAILVATLVVLTVAFWRLFAKTGRPAALALLMLAPVVNLGVMLWFAFTEWPVEAEIRRLRTVVATYAAVGAPDAAVDAGQAESAVAATLAT